MSVGLVERLSSEPLLNAFDEFSGSFVDLDRRLEINAAAFVRGWRGLSERLSRQGLAQADRVVVSVSNGPQFSATLAALLANGASPLLVHWQTPARELLRTAQHYGARFIVCDGDRLEEVRSLMRRGQSISQDVWIDLAWLEVDDKSTHFNERWPSLPGVPLHPTSGTTGLPKVAARPAFCALEEARHYIERIDIDYDDVLLATPPMSHAYAYGMCVMVPLLSGARVVTMRAFKAQPALQALRDHEITLFPAVPAMLDVMAFGSPQGMLGPRRCVLTAGSPLPERTATRFQQAFKTEIRPLYGTTETGGISVGLAGAPLPAVGTVGPAMAGVEIEVRPHSGAAERADGAGMLWVRSSSMMAGYLDEHGIDESPLHDDWFQTGDLAVVNASGEIRLLGRETEVINVSGMKVIPSEVEQVIAALPGVLEVKVYAGRRRSGDQFVQAALVVDPGITAERVRTYCAEQFIYYKRPERYHILETLPRSPSGKIQVQQLP